LLAAGARAREGTPGPVQARVARRDRYERDLCDGVKSCNDEDCGDDRLLVAIDRGKSLRPARERARARY